MSDYCICPECGCKHLVWEKNCPYCRELKAQQARIEELEAERLAISEYCWARSGGNVRTVAGDIYRYLNQGEALGEGE